MSETTTAPAEQADAEAPALPVALRVTRGNPTDEELAALLLVVAAASGGDDEGDGRPRGVWASRARNLGVSSLGSRRRSSWGWRQAR